MSMRTHVPTFADYTAECGLVDVSIVPSYDRDTQSTNIINEPPILGVETVNLCRLVDHMTDPFAGGASSRRDDLSRTSGKVILDHSDISENVAVDPGILELSENNNVDGDRCFLHVTGKGSGSVEKHKFSILNNSGTVQYPSDMLLISGKYDGSNISSKEVLLPCGNLDAAPLTA